MLGKKITLAFVLAFGLLVLNAFISYAHATAFTIVATLLNLLLLVFMAYLIRAEISRRNDQAREALNKSEDEYRKLFLGNPQPMWLYDPQTLAFIAVNDSASLQYGYSREEFLAMTIKDIRPPEDVPALLENVRGLRSRLQYGERWRHRKKDGSVIDVEIAGNEMQFAGRRARLVMAADITERVRAERALTHSEEALRRLNAELEQRVNERTEKLAEANRELEAFSYSVSHDLRAPLRAIDGFSQALERQYQGRLDDTGLHYLRRVRAGTRQMGQLIDDLLQLSRITRAEISRKTVDLSAIARRIADDLRHAEPIRRVEFIIADDVRAAGDTNLLSIALENLLRNAWKFTAKQAAARIEFGIDETAAARVYFLRDNGAGFDMAYADKLFGVFQRLHRVEEYAGTGIGLATVQRIIQRHGGAIWAEAAVNQGARFCFTLDGPRPGEVARIALQG